MDITFNPGQYVIAVSGGVDSVTLLHMLKNLPDIHLTVAHFDHGIREDSKEDRQLVERLASRYHLPFVYHEGHLGPGTCESEARKARYEFLRKVQKATLADAIVTAHHQDDLIETAIINLFRGTGRKGLSSLQNVDKLLRPLLHIPKRDLVAYAQEHSLVWRNDSTNQDTRYLRNYVRAAIVPKFSKQGRERFLQNIIRTTELNKLIDRDLTNYLHMQLSLLELDRNDFIMLPHVVACEVMVAWLRNNGIRKFDKRLLERLVVSAKTLPAGKQVDVDLECIMILDPDKLALSTRDR